MKKWLFLPLFEKVSDITLLIILLMPIFRYYDLPGTSMGSESAMSLALLILSGFLLLNKSRTIYDYGLNRSANYFTLFTIWTIFVTVTTELSGISSGNINNAIVASIVALSICFCLKSGISTKRMLNMYDKIVYIVLIIYVFQFALMLSGKMISFKMPFHEYNGSWDFGPWYIFGMQDGNTSIFSERAHFSEYLLPFLCLNLFDSEYVEKGGVWKALFVTIAILMTISGTGTVLVAIIWLLYYTVFSSTSGGKKVIIAIIGVVLLFGLYIFLLTIPEFEDMFGKLFFNSSGTMDGSNKSSFRVYRGWDYVFKMPFEYLLSGVGFVHMEVFCKQYGLMSKFDDPFKIFEWFSGITEVILYYGLIGLGIFSMHMRSLYYSRTRLTKCMVIILIALFFTSQVLFLETQIFYLMLIVCTINRTSQKI